MTELPPLRVEIERRLAQKLDLPFDPNAPLTNALVFFFEEPSLYLDWSHIAELKLDGERVKRALKEVLLGIDGVDHVFTNSELLAATAPASELERQVRESFRADRSGDLLIILRDHWIWSYNVKNTTHGQPLPSDQHVPLLLWGATVKPGHSSARVAPTDLAHTLGAMYGLEVGSPGSHVLPCITTMASDADLDALLNAALSSIDPKSTRTFTLSKGLDARVRAAIATKRTVATPPSSDTVSLPADYARVDAFTIDGDHATVKVWLGPVEKPKAGVMSLSCGTGMTIYFEHRNGAWVETSRGIAVC